MEGWTPRSRTTDPEDRNVREDIKKEDRQVLPLIRHNREMPNILNSQFTPSLEGYNDTE